MSPEPRSAPTFAIDKEEKKIYLFSGANHEGYLNDFYSYDIEHKLWEKVHCEGKCP